MKRIILTAVCMLCAMAISATAAEGKKKGRQMNDEQKAVYKQMCEKYDANKDGRIDKDERAKMKAEDKKAMAKAFKKEEGEDGEKKGEKKDGKKGEKKGEKKGGKKNKSS